MLRETDVFDAQGFSFADVGEQKAPALVTVEKGAHGVAATIADAHLLFNSDFTRSGNDLRIDGHDGERAIVRDYFGAGERAALMSAEGARLSRDLVEALTKSVAPHQYAQATPPAPAASDAVGRVVTASPDSTILRNGVPVTVTAGDPVLRADVLQTAGGTMAVTFNDGSTLNLTANTRIVVSEFIYSPSNTGNSQLLDLIQGSLTFISGEVAHTGDMRIGTPVATMGIRGTVGGVTTASDGTVQFYVSQSATGAVIINQQGQIIANVVQDGPLIVVRPVGPLQVIADEIQKSPAQLAVELQALQQIVNIKAIGDQLLQQFFQQQQQQSPNPQSPQNGPHTQIPIDDKLKITLFLDDQGGNGGVTPVTHAVIETIKNDHGTPQTPIPTPIPVNLPPVTFAHLSLTTAEDTPLVFGGSKAISVVDNDSQTLTLTLSVTNGVLTLGSVAGLSFSSGDGASDGAMTFSGSPAAIAAALNGLTYTPSQDYNGPATLSISAGDGNSAPLTTTVSVSVTAVNDAPVVGSTATAPVAYTENDGATVVNATLMISDVDSATLSGATVKIAANFAFGEDVLSFTSQGGITGTYDAQTGILTLSGVASLADYEAVLRSVTYENTSGNPSNAPRTIEFQVDDGSSEHSTSNVISTVVNVSSTNDAPVLTLGGRVADQFASQAFSLNSGTANWTTDWVENENGDYASSPTTGEIQIRTDPSVSDTGFRLFLSDDDSEAGAADTIQRSADLTGATSATLTFDYRRQINSGDPSDIVKIWASTDGINFTQIGQIGATGSGTFIDQTYQHFSVDLTGYISPATTIRFSIDDGADDTDWFYIDNVKIDYSAIPTYVEGGSAVSIAPAGASIKDADNTTLQSATVTLTNAQADDLLSVNGQLPAGIVASSYDAQTGVLTLTGSATLAAYQAALAQIQFSNTGDNPGSADRTVTIVVSDGSATSNTGTVTVHVTPVNDAPVAAITPTSYNATEQTALTLKGTGLSISDADAASGSMTVTLSVTEGVLNATAGDSGASVSNSGTSSLTITGTAAQINALLAAGGTGTLNYINNSNTPAASATLTLAVNDNGNTGSGGGLAGSDTATINIAAVNDAPAAAITPASYAATEQTALTLKGSGLSISDVDAASGSMTVTLSVTNGVLNATAGDSGASVSNSGTSSLTITGTVAQINALLASGGTSTLSYINNSDAPPSSATLTLQVADNGNTGGGSLTASDTATINIAGVNDAPLASDTANPGTFTEDTDTVIAASTLLANASDPDGDTLTITAVGNSANSGTVTLNGTNITYHPAANFSGFDYFVYTVSDGQTSIQRAATFTVAAVNDAPAAAITPASYNATEQTALTLKGSGLSISDVDAASGSMTVTLSVTNGVLNATAGDSGASVSNSGTSSLTITGTVAQINALLATGGASTLSYINNSDAPPASATLTLAVNDNGNTGSGGSLTASDTATINITPVNDAPVASDTANPGTFTEDTDTVIAASTLLANASDPDGDTLTITAVGNSANSGTVTLNGTNITYHPAANFSGFDYFVYTVSDGQTSIQRAATFTVAAVNDAPSVNANGASLSYSEDQAAAAIAPSIAVTDVDNTSLTGATVTITGNFSASEDVLGFTNQNGISGSYNSTTGILALTGAATLAQYQAALASVTYSNAHALSTATRTVSFSVTDGQASSNVGTVDVTVAAVNDTVTLSAAAWAAAGTINLGGGTNVVNVQASSDISAAGTPTVSNVTTGNLIGTGSDDSVTLTGAQLDTILIGTGTIDLGAGTGDIINLKSTSGDLNTLGATDASIAGVEAISAAGAGAGVIINLSGQNEAFNITGSANADTLTGGGAADTINGGDGNDTITGGASGDTLNGGNGADIFVYTSAAHLTGDTVDGVHDNANDDTIRLDGAGTYDFATATISNIDSVNIGVDAAGFNIVLTDDMASTAAYKGTNTAIEGRIRVNATVAVSNDVTIDASDLQSGHRLFVNASNLNGNDTITGGAGADNIGGGAGNDTITGGAGNDDLTGGGGADTFVFHAGFGIDTVSGFDETLDYLQFDQGVFANVAALLAATTDSGANTVIQYDASNKVTLEGVQKADLLAHTDHILIV